MRSTTVFLCLVLFCCALPFHAQPFLRSKPGEPRGFKELQLKFHDFEKQNDLKKSKLWKHYRRYEYEMQLHTNGRGEPDGFDTYINEALNAAAYQRGTEASGVWSPFGTSNVPNNLQGYAENGIGRINCITFHPTDTNTYYVGVAQGGLWKTTNGGASYTPLTDNLPITRISDVALDPTDPNTIYISVCDFEYIGFGLYLNGRKRHTHFGLGVYKSTNGGQTWTATGLTFQLTNGDASLIRKIVVNPANNNEVLACGVSGMYRSINGGSTWIKKSDSLFWDMVQDPGSPSTIYAATGWVMTSDIGSAGIYKSTDFGQTWTLLNTGIPARNSVQRIKLAVAPGNSNYVYALACDDLYGLYGLYLSTNAGTSWTLKTPQDNILEWDQGSNSGGQGTYDLALCVNDNNPNLIYTGGINIWGSSDAGDNFSPVTHWTYQFGNNTIHADVHMISKQPGTKNIFVCCDGGLYKTRNMTLHNWNGGWPTIWKNMSDGMQITSFYRLSSSRNSAGRMAAGAQDNSTFYFDGSTWSTVFGGDGMDNFLESGNNQVLIGSSQYGTFYYSNDNGQSGIVVGSNPNNESSEWVTPIAANYSAPGVLYIGNENVARSTDGGQSWTVLGSIFSNTLTQSNTEISALCVSQTSGSVIYAARRVRYELNMKGMVMKSVNGGSSFTNITGNLPDTLYYTGIETRPGNASEVVVCMAGFAGGCKVFRSLTGGGTWTNISYNLPNVPVNCIKYVPVSNQLIVATDFGLYYLNPGSTSWTAYSSGLPNVICSDIEFNSVKNKMYVSTFGRGIWETSLSGLSVLADGINENFAAGRQVDVYPSINKGNFTVDLKDDTRYNLSIVDVLGRTVYSKEENSGKLELSLNVPPGAYYVRVENAERISVHKIVVQ